MQDSEFSIGKHVFAGDCGGNGLQDYVARLLGEDLPADKPPWELRVLPSCGHRKAEVAVVLRVHHALADGETLVRVLCHALADNPVTRPKQAWCRGSAVSRWLALVRGALLSPLALLGWLLLRARDDNLLLAGKSCSPAQGVQGKGRQGPVSVAWSAGIALSKVRRIQQVSRCTLNCVLLSAVGGAARTLLQGCGVRQPPDLKVALPVSMHRPGPRSSHGVKEGVGGGVKFATAAGSGPVGSRAASRSSSSTSDPEEGLGAAGVPGIRRSMSSKTVPVVLGLPVSVEGAVPRLWATRRCLQYLRSSADPVVVYVASLAGTWAARLLAALTDKASLQFAVLGGPSSTVLIGGAVLKAVYALQPAPGRLGVAMSVFTYADQVFVTVASDAALGPAGSLLLHHVNVQIELLWRLLQHRRAPGEPRPPPSLRSVDVQASPVGELTSRLSYVQEELERLASEGDDAQDSGREECVGPGQGQGVAGARLSSLKAEFTSLLNEVRKRQARTRRSPRQRRRPHPRSPERIGGGGVGGGLGGETGGEAGGGAGRGGRKRRVSFSLPLSQRALGGLLGSGGVGGRTPPDLSEAMILDDGAPAATSSPCHSSHDHHVIDVPDDEDVTSRSRWVRASFERAARRSHSGLDPLLRAYFRDVEMESSCGAYPCRCRHPGDSGDTPSSSQASQGVEEEEEEEEEFVGQTYRRKRSVTSRTSRTSSEQEYEAIVDAYYPPELRNRTKFDLCEEEGNGSPEILATESRRPSCLKKVPRRDTPPSDQSSPSLSTSVLHQLRSYYEDSYLSYSRQMDDFVDADDLDEELPPPRERLSAFSSNSRQSVAPNTCLLQVPSRDRTGLSPHRSFTCTDADQLKYADADSDPATPVLVDGQMAASPTSTQTTTLSVKSSPQNILSDASTSPRPKFFTQSSSGSPVPTRPRAKRHSSGDNGYYEESVCPSLSEPDAPSLLSNDVISADSVINLTSSSTSPSPASRLEEARYRLMSPFQECSSDTENEHSVRVKQLEIQQAKQVALFLEDNQLSPVRPNSLIIKKNYRD